MTRYSLRQNNFSSGEISPLLEARGDFLRVKTGASKMRGYLPLRQGGFTRAPGTIHRGVTDGNSAGRLVNFEFAADDAVVLEFTPLKMRVWRYGVLVDDGGSPYELVTPYDADALERLVWVQSADVIYLVDGELPMQKLSRFALDNWTIAPVVFNSGPFRVQNLDDALTLQASAETGTVTLTASQAFFESDHVGSLIRMVPVDYTAIPLWTGDTSIAVGAKMRYDGNVYELTAGSNTGVNPPLHLEGTELVDGNGATWQFLSDDSGIVRITAINSPTSADAEVIKRLPDGVVTDPTYRFAEGAWSDRYGYPAALELYDQRLVAAATPSDPRTLWFSTAGAFEDFEPSAEADGSFAYAIAGQNTLNRILWLRGGNQSLHIGALGEEYSARSNDRNVVIGSATTTFGRDSGIGSADAQAIAPDGWPIFISKDGAKLFQLRYSLDDDALRPRELSLPSDHLGADRFREIVWQGAPLRIAWIRRESGQLAAMVHEPNEEVLGWAPYSLAGGIVESMAVSSSADAATDVLTLIVRRTIDGQTVRMIEEQALTYGILSGAQPIADAVHFFAASVFSEDPETDTFSVPHLVGEEVFVWTEKGQFGPYIVPANGEVIISETASMAVIGLFDDTHVCRMLPYVPPAQDGETSGRMRRAHAPLGVRLHRTAAGTVAAVERDVGQSERIWPTVPLIETPVAQALTESFTGTVEVHAPSGEAVDVMHEYRPVGGAPMTILSQTATIEEEGV